MTAVPVQLPVELGVVVEEVRERLADRPGAPELVVRGFFDTAAHAQDRWAASNHATLHRSIQASPTVDIPGSELACGNWLAGQALDRLAPTA